MAESRSGRQRMLVDLGDFDAIGILTEAVQQVRSIAIERDVEIKGWISAQEGWHEVFFTARPSGHVVLGIRYQGLTQSRRNNVAKALTQRNWHLDEDGDGATYRFPPGTDASTPAFEMLDVTTLGGAPADRRMVCAIDESNAEVPLWM